MISIIARSAVSLLLIFLLFTPAGAVQPDEILSDTALETRARNLSKELRCLVCRNESIDDSNAPLARDLRLVVRKRLVAGDSDDQVLAFLVERYGEYVLLRPRFSTANAALWLSGPLIFLIGLLIAVRYIRGQRSVAPKPLSQEEREDLNRILED